MPGAFGDADWQLLGGKHVQDRNVSCIARRLYLDRIWARKQAIAHTYWRRAYANLWFSAKPHRKSFKRTAAIWAYGNHACRCRHIESIVKLLNVQELDFEVGDIWFNAWKHLCLPIGMNLGRCRVNMSAPWYNNTDYPGIRPSIMACGCAWRCWSAVDRFAGRMKLTLLSPDTGRLARLALNGQKQFVPQD